MHSSFAPFYRKVREYASPSQGAMRRTQWPRRKALDRAPSPQAPQAVTYTMAGTWLRRVRSLATTCTGVRKGGQSGGPGLPLRQCQTCSEGKKGV